MESEKVLAYLSPGEWISGEEVASYLGISRAAVWKQVQSLRAKGYCIESSTRRGYCLTHKPDLLDSEAIQSGLNARIIGNKVLCFQEVSSTNDLAKSMARDSPEGAVFLAESQVQGRGRLARSWASPRGGLWMSVLLKPEIALVQAYRINMAVSVALARAISSLYGLDARIKWPNDLLVKERKLCGMLMEISAEVDRLEYAVVGIGINANVDVSVFPEEWRATSLSHELGHEISRIELIRKILQEMEDTYSNMASEDLYSEWRNRSATLGRRVRVTSGTGDIEGLVVDLCQDGALFLKSESGSKRILAGDCIHLREAEA